MIQDMFNSCCARSNGRNLKNISYLFYRKIQFKVKKEDRSNQNRFDKNLGNIGNM